ncbi:hypothetical protein VM1G_10562 [Cytospora mali]|uniref:Transcription factor IIIC 90kDa subunit N-terminal domain-containing protein n=1 Tax=Cytospora mali TaxID=578113 RepID=A0A194VHY3_CYTMA|nr:hypothetical protein VM1G_10562 [Valsa mali]
MSSHYISQILPLRGLNFKSKPFNQRAIAWSCDAELAVAADDSVYVCQPQFPILDPNTEDDSDVDDGAKSEPDEHDGNMGFLSSRLPKQYGDNDEDDDRLEDDSEDDDIEPANPTTTTTTTGGRPPDDTHAAATRAAADPVDTSDPRKQFLDGMRHLPVSYPYLSPDLNAHVWEAAGREMPLIHTNVRDSRDRDVTHILDAMPKDGDEEAEHREAGGVIPFHDVNHHPGAGVGVIGSAGTSLNHVVAIEWSPSGIGKNRRPVLAVLTGCGSLAVYGEGCALPFGSTVRPLRSVAMRGKGAVRDLASWVVLWAVGENFVVPGQEEYGYGEFVKAFAWSRATGDGKALLGYMNDQREVVVLCVGAEYRKSKEDGLDEAVWNVQEMCRFEAEGPHGQQDPMDPDFVPSGSSFCIRWSPWIKGEKTWTCVLSYMDRNYIGFRRITVNIPTWKPTKAPIISYDPHDWDGRCVHLGADAFLEFENTAWTVGNKEVCRGFVATPLVAESFEVDLAHSNPHMPKPEHSSDKCDTTYDKHDSITNPITGLIVHPVSLQTVSPSLVPSYTAVRLSATATNQGWWESNLGAKSGNVSKEPQWAIDIQEIINTVTPLGLAGLTGDDDGEEDGQDQIVEGEEEAQNRNEEWDTDEDEVEDEDEDDDDDDDDDDDMDTVPAYEGPDVHPLRMRIWGLAASPGGGSTAVLASQQLTQHPERGGWHNHRSRVLFDHKGRREVRRSTQGQSQGGGTMDLDEDESTVNVDNLTTEARLWEWMYGGGPGVPGITHYPEQDGTADADADNDSPGKAQEAKDVLAQARRDMIRAVFRPFARDQTCSICADGETRFLIYEGDEADGGRQLDCACERGHRVALCGASGLAILEPGISRCCGVCRSRCLGVGVLVERVLLPAGRKDDAEMVRREVPGDVCVRCGGKYLD